VNYLLKVITRRKSHRRDLNLRPTGYRSRSRHANHSVTALPRMSFYKAFESLNQFFTSVMSAKNVYWSRESKKSKRCTCWTKWAALWRLYDRYSYCSESYLVNLGDVFATSSSVCWEYNEFCINCLPHACSDWSRVIYSAMASSLFLRQRALHAIFHDGFWKSDYDFLIVFLSNFLSTLHAWFPR